MLSLILLAAASLAIPEFDSAPSSPQPVAHRASAASSTKQGAIAAMAPDFALRDVKGKTVRLRDFRGKVVVIEFWATWCGPCVRGLPVIADVAKREGSDVVFLAINSDDNEGVDRVRDFLRERKLDVRALLGGREVSLDFGVGPIPHTVVVARDGSIVGQHVGFSNENAVRAQLRDDIATAKRRR